MAMETLNIPHENRRASSVSSCNVPLQALGRTRAQVSYGSVQAIPLIPSAHESAREYDPLSILIPMTDLVLIITAIIFIMAIGIVALLVIMAITKMYFSQSNLNSFWTNEWFSSE